MNHNDFLCKPSYQVLRKELAPLHRLIVQIEISFSGVSNDTNKDCVSFKVKDVLIQAWLTGKPLPCYMEHSPIDLYYLHL